MRFALNHSHDRNRGLRVGVRVTLRRPGFKSEGVSLIGLK